METLRFNTKAEWLAQREKDLTSTDIAALFGVSPYKTPYQLWMIKHGRIKDDITENEAMRWGTRLQDAIAAGIAEEQGWKISRMDEYIRLSDLRLGSSFDFSIDDETILEIKNVGIRAYSAGWTDTAAPKHIELQCQHQLLVSGRRTVYLGALVGGNRTVLLKRERDENVIQLIREKAAAFWASTEPPAPDANKDTLAVIEALQYAEPNTELGYIESVEQLCQKYSEYGKKAKEVEEIREKLKVQILTAMGSAERYSGKQFTVAAKMVAPAEISYTRKGYRGFTVKGKKDAE